MLKVVFVLDPQDPKEECFYNFFLWITHLDVRWISYAVLPKEGWWAGETTSLLRISTALMMAPTEGFFCRP
jgi:hypothetical protein